MVSRYIRAGILLAIGILLIALNMGDLFQFEITTGVISINGPASLGSILVILSAFVLLDLL